MSETPITRKLSEEFEGKRLDIVLAELFPEYSRSRLKQWIDQGQVLLDGDTVRPGKKVVGGEELKISIQPMAAEADCRAEAIPLDIVYEDEAIIVINKPADLVVHPAAGNYSGTVQNALLHHDNSLAAIPRAGIVHRLDKDTTGLMVVARTPGSHKYLVDAIQRHEVVREYLAVVHGVMTGGGRVDRPIGRHPRDRIKMAVTKNGREAVTHYRLLQRFRLHSLLKVRLETGRTHQIRVHMSYIHHPLLGDPVYAGRQRLPSAASQELIACIQTFRRQALHAWKLSFTHPLHGEEVSFEAPLPEDMQKLIDLLQDDLREHDTK